MNTPIVDFVKKYADSSILRLHMPGHKGRELLGPEPLDITEIKGADALYDAEGIIGESEKNAASLFGTKGTFYSCEGSTQCIKAMLYLVASQRKNRDRRTHVLAAANAHKAFVYGCGLMDIDVTRLWDDSEDFSLCRCRIAPDSLKKALAEGDFDAVYITSPDYLGNMADIETVANISHSFGVPLIVDNAHGAYLGFLEKSLHPIHLGADMCCDSAHKTLPVLTGGAYLHINEEKYLSEAKAALELFGSTSPSYLILQSLDLANKYLSHGYRERLAHCVARVDELRLNLKNMGIEVLLSDPLKLTVCSYGENLSQRLRSCGMECEYEDPDYTVMMFTPETPPEAYERLLAALTGFKSESVKPLRLTPPEKRCSVREAILAPQETVAVAQSVGRVLASPTVGCPPAVPVVISGEVISPEAAAVMEYYGVTHVRVMVG